MRWLRAAKAWCFVREEESVSVRHRLLLSMKRHTLGEKKGVEKFPRRSFDVGPVTSERRSGREISRAESHCERKKQLRGYCAALGHSHVAIRGTSASVEA